MPEEYLDTSLMRCPQCGSPVNNTTLYEKTNPSLQEINSLYQASLKLSQSSTSSDVMEIIQLTLLKSPYLSALFKVEGNALKLINEQRPDLTNWDVYSNKLIYPDLIELSLCDFENALGKGKNYITIDRSNETAIGGEFPSVLTPITSNEDCTSLALIPGWNGANLELLFVLGTKEIIHFNSEILEPYCRLAHLAIINLNRVTVSQRLEKHLVALQTLNTVSQAISLETNLDALYQVIHREVTSIIGKVNFAIATYDEQLDTITVPYLYDGLTTRSIEAFPMGEGLTSILIKTKKSLLLVEDTEQKTKELGAKQVGKPAKSWLGVPLLVAGEVIGAILLQDLEQERRFNEDDQHLLETLSSQVAVAIRNILLLDRISMQVTRQKQLYEITSKIRSSSDISSILHATVSELSKVLGARVARIELNSPSSERRAQVSH